MGRELTPNVWVGELTPNVCVGELIPNVCVGELTPNVCVGELTPNVFSGCSVPAIRASFSTTCLKNCGKGECLGTTTCLMTVAGGKQGHAPCRMLPLQQILFFVSLKFHGDHKTVTKMR